MTDPRSPARSLIERVAAAYDFGAAAARPVKVPEAYRTAPPPLPLDPVEAEAVDVAGERAPWAEAPAENRIGTIDVERLRKAGFVMPDAPVSALAEEIRIVKRQLLVAAVRENASPRDRVILVASAQADEGKTFCAVNLALSMAVERDHEVLLVDADVAKPSILSTLGLEAGPGLIDALHDPSIDPETCVIRTDVGRLSVLPAGRASNEATELLASDRTRRVLDRLTQRRQRIVLFDSPPTLAASPASELARHAGQVLLVVRADKTSESDLREAAGLLSACPSIQLLLNGVRYQSGGRKFGSYYGHGE